MMLIRQAVLGLIGLAAGVTTAAGVYALITVVGIIPRLAGKSRTGKYIRFYETAVIVGGISGCITDIYQLSIVVGRIGLGVMGDGIWSFYRQSDYVAWRKRWMCFPLWSGGSGWKRDCRISFWGWQPERPWEHFYFFGKDGKS